MKKLFRWLVIASLVASLLGVAAIGVAWLVYGRSLPDVESLRDVQLQVPLRVFTEDRRLIGIFGEKRRIPIVIEDTPACLKQAFIAGEDARFYEHPGVDYQGITRAAYTRKIKEIFLALRIERELDKDQILELYMNKIFLGYRAYGVGAAAEVYYGKSPEQLSLAQCAMIAALPKAPSRINPITSPERALERRDYVLSRMLELGYIEPDRYRQAIAEPDRAYYHGAIAEISAPFHSCNNCWRSASGNTSRLRAVCLCTVPETPCSKASTNAVNAVFI